MFDEKRQEIMRRQAEGMRAMTNEEMARRQIEAEDGMRQRGPATACEQEAMRNFWGATADAQNNLIPDLPPPSLWARIKQWIRA